jgi:hypothetical protein
VLPTAAIADAAAVSFAAFTMLNNVLRDIVLTEQQVAAAAAAVWLLLLLLLMLSRPVTPMPLRTLSVQITAQKSLCLPSSAPKSGAGADVER